MRKRPLSSLSFSRRPEREPANTAAGKARNTFSRKRGHATLPRNRRRGGKDVLSSVEGTPRGGVRGLRTGCVALYSQQPWAWCSQPGLRE
jgi:hypothetical protein